MNLPNQVVLVFSTSHLLVSHSLPCCFAISVFGESLRARFDSRIDLEANLCAHILLSSS